MDAGSYVVNATNGNRERFGRILEMNANVRVDVDGASAGNILAAVGELHLEIIVDRLLREFKVEANVGKPQVAYRETAGKAVSNVEGKFVRQTGGHGQYGHCVINMEPLPAGTGYQFENKIVGGVVPKEYIPSIDKGIQEALNTGVISGYPVVSFPRSTSRPSTRASRRR